MRYVLQPAKTAFVCLIATIPMIRAFEHHQLYRPNHQQLGTPQAYHLAYEDIWFESGDGAKLHGWWIPSNHVRAPILLLCHGQGGNISDRLNKVVRWHRLGASVFLFDYRGYGRSSGNPSEKGLYQDVEAAYDMIHRREPKARLFIYGASLGGGVATELAVHEHDAGLILEDTFTSIQDMARHRYPRLPLDWLVSERYDNLSKIDHIDSPILIFHSIDDEVVPYEMGRRLYEKALTPKRFVTLRGSHDAAFAVSAPAYDAALTKFLSE
jgi:fermentation-respiration switch protein FrsA (DUF1100 family)